MILNKRVENLKPSVYCHQLRGNFNEGWGKTFEVRYEYSRTSFIHGEIKYNAEFLYIFKNTDGSLTLDTSTESYSNCLFWLKMPLKLEFYLSCYIKLKRDSAWDPSQILAFFLPWIQTWPFFYSMRTAWMGSKATFSA